MRKSLFALALSATAGLGWASSPLRADGSYHLVPNEATQQFCRRHHLELPSGHLVLRPNGTFSLVVQDDEGTMRTRGNYDVVDDRVEFEIEDGPGIHLASRMRLDEDGLHGRGAEYDRDEPIVEYRPKPRREPASLPAPAPVRTLCEVKGVWTLRRNGIEDKSTRFTFDPNGTFRYRGENSDSRGNYVVTLDGIELTWTEIDGGPVDPHASNRKMLPTTFSGDAFYVDDYRYERSTIR